jgi:hypothetical protein
LAACWNGKDLLLISAGDSAEVPGGYTPIGHGIAAAGPAERIEAARSAQAEGKNHARDLPDGDAQVRIVVRGDGRLPLTGNLANLTKLLRMADATTIALRIRDQVDVEIVGRCRSAQQAQSLEESVRAIITMARSLRSKDSRLAALLQSVRITRESEIVRIQGAGPAEAIRGLF